MMNRRWSTGISLLVASFLFFPVFSASPAYPATAKKKLSKIKSELRKKKQRIKETVKREKSVISRIDGIDREIDKKQKELKAYDRQISKIRSNILSLSKETAVVAGQLTKKEKHLEKRLKTLYKQRYGDAALILITANDYQDLIRRSRYLSLLAHHDSRTIKEYRKELNDLQFKKKKMQILHDRLTSRKKSARKKKRELRSSLVKKKKLLATVRSKRSSYEKAVKELEASSKRLQNIINNLKKKKIPRSVRGKGFKALRKHLPWPIKGKVLVPFGKYKDPKFNIPVFKNGIEIRAKRGAQPKAVAGGRVVYADWFKGYGLLLIINHGRGYHSLYGNLSEIFHKTGSIIQQGTAVGKIGSSGLLGVPTLYFEIRYKGKPVDPLKWLKRRGVRR